MQQPEAPLAPRQRLKGLQGLQGLQSPMSYYSCNFRLKINIKCKKRDQITSNIKDMVKWKGKRCRKSLFKLIRIVAQSNKNAKQCR